MPETGTPTPTLTLTPTPTETATPTVTPTPTLDFVIEVTLEPGSDQGARIVREVTLADMTVILLLFAVLMSMWVMFILIRMKK